MKNKNVVRSIKHTLKFANKDKKDMLKSILTEGRRVAMVYLDYLWMNRVDYKVKDVPHHFDIQMEQLDVPKWLSNPQIQQAISDFSTSLSGRLCTCILTQVLGCIKAATELQKKRYYVYSKHPSQALADAIAEGTPVKPNIERMNLELNSICASFVEGDFETFDLFIELRSLIKGYGKGKIAIPIKLHRGDKKYKGKKWTRLSSILLTGNDIQIRYSKQMEPKQKGKLLGADTGSRNIVALSDGQLTAKQNEHGHTLQSVQQEMARKRKGSKAFKALQELRTNLVNWSINQLNLKGVRQVNLEEIDDSLRRGKRVKREMSHWPYVEIEEKIIRCCEEQDVLVVLQDSSYKSQRCYGCSLVKKSNRDEEVYECECGYHEHVDVNGAKNNTLDLFPIPGWLLGSGLNKDGFYWDSSGIYDRFGEALTVPLDTTIKT